MPPEERQRQAMRIKGIHDVVLPRLAYFNYDPCPRHAPTPFPLCKQCGIRFRRHQRVGVMWMYMNDHCMLGDGTGMGKTGQAAGALAWCKETGELSLASRAVVVCQASAVRQWEAELRRFIPSLAVSTAIGDQRQRLTRYVEPWEVMVISDRTLISRGDRDLDCLMSMPLGTVVYDDVDAMRHHGNRTAQFVTRLCHGVPRVHALHATPLQKAITEIHSFTRPLDTDNLLGTIRWFERRYVEKENITLWKTSSRTGRKTSRVVKKEVGIKNVRELQELLRPMVLRRTAGDVDDMNMPQIQPNVVWLEPSAEQARRYAELRQGIVRMLRDGQASVSQAEAAARFMHGWQICSGTATLDDTTDASVKLDWVVDRLTGDLARDKAVVFVNFKPNVAALSRRLTAAGVGHVLMWGNESNANERWRRQEAFTYDPAVRVLIGTTTIERSLNLQAARHLIAVDTILNPARMTQIVGRVARDGSVHQFVLFHQLLLRGTQEEGYLELLEREQAMADAVWGEHHEIFNHMTPMQMLQLVAGGNYGQAAA